MRVPTVNQKLFANVKSFWTTYPVSTQGWGDDHSLGENLWGFNFWKLFFSLFRFYNLATIHIVMETRKYANKMYSHISKADTKSYSIFQLIQLWILKICKLISNLQGVRYTNIPIFRRRAYKVQYGLGFQKYYLFTAYISTKKQAKYVLQKNKYSLVLNETKSL